MIPNTEVKDVSVSSNFETNAFTIQASAKAFDILSSNIYTHKVRAVIRELSCNAQDSHVDAGNPDPFTVHIPTMLEPWFSVRDYGTGLSHEDCMELYTTYFHSTKATSNDFTGFLGVGSKSPYSLVDSFTVTSYFNGEVRAYSCYKDEEGMPQIALLTTTETDEPNGLEINVNAEGRTSEFRREAVYVFKFFKTIPNINVEHIKEDIQRDREKYTISGDKFALTGSSGSLLAVMGNVPYKIPVSVDPQVTELEGYLVFDLGELSFDPGRENLSLDKPTTAALEKRIAAFRTELGNLVKKQVNEHKTPYKRFIAVQELQTGLLAKISGVSTKDYPLGKPSTPIVTHVKHSYQSTIDKYVRDSFDEAYSVKGTTRIFFEKRGYMTRLRCWLKGDRYTARKAIIVTEEQAKEIGIDADVIEDMEALPKPDNSSGGARTAYDKCKVFTWDREGTGNYGSQTWENAEIDGNSTDEVIYVEINNWTMKNSTYGDPSLVTAKDAFECFGLTLPTIYGLKTAFLKTRQFKKMNWISLKDYIDREAKKCPEKTVHIYSGCGSRSRLIRNIAKLELVDGSRTRNIKEFDRLSGLEIKNTHSFKGLGFKIKVDTKLNDIANDIYQSYPMLGLLPSYHSSKMEPIQHYINSNPDDLSNEVTETISTLLGDTDA